MAPDFRSQTFAGLTWAETLDVRRCAIVLHALGTRALYEFLTATLLDLNAAQRRALFARLGQYADLDPDTLRVLGADQLPPIPPPREVR